MRLVSEYEPVQKLCLSFVHEFFNTRFNYGKTLCKIIQVVKEYVEVEVWASRADMPILQAICRDEGIILDKILINHDAPGRGIIAEYAPIFACDDLGHGVGLVFQHPFLDEANALHDFSQRLTHRLGFGVLELGFEFATTHLLVNDNMVLLSERLFRGLAGALRKQRLTELFPTQTFHVVPALAGDITADLDMYLWPIAPRIWLMSEYPAHTCQAASIAPTLRVLREHGHIVHRVPGLSPLVFEDVNTMPNYANGIIVNRIALVPAYQREEDRFVVNLLQDYGYQVFPIDCSQIILSNSGLHCISKTVPIITRLDLEPGSWQLTAPGTRWRAQ